MARLQILSAALLFGTTGTAQALTPGAGSPVSVGAARIVIGGALLALIAWALARRAEPTGLRWDRRLVVAGGLCVAIYQVTFFAAVDLTGVAVGTVVAIGSAPAIAGLLARATAGEPLTGRWAAATALAVAGVALLAGGGGGDVDPAGIGLALVSGGGYAGYATVSKRLLGHGHGPEGTMAAVFGLGALILVPVLALSSPGWLSEPDGAALALYLGIVPTAFAYVLFARGLRAVPTGEAATLTLAEPLAAAALGVAVLAEDPGLTGLAGALLVLAGLALLAVPGREAPVAGPAARSYARA